MKRLREFPPAARQDAGHQLYRVQRGEQPDDFKPLPTVGQGVEAIRVWDETGTYRVIDTARQAETVYVLHAFQKKTPAPSKRDLDIAKARFAQIASR